MIDPSCCCGGEDECDITGGLVAMLTLGGLVGADTELKRPARSSTAWPLEVAPFGGALSSKSMSDKPPPADELLPASSAGMGFDENE